MATFRVAEPGELTYLVSDSNVTLNNVAVDCTTDGSSFNKYFSRCNNNLVTQNSSSDVTASAYGYYSDIANLNVTGTITFRMGYENSYLLPQDTTDTAFSTASLRGAPEEDNTGTAIYNTGINITVSNNYITWVNPALLMEPEERERYMKREKLRANLRVNIRARGTGIPSDVPENEQAALELVREMVSEEQFRRYLKHGFVMVRGASGDMYQVFRGHGHTRVWRNGVFVEEVCVQIRHAHKCPPSDYVLARMMMIENDEQAFRRAGNVFPRNVPVRAAA